MLKQSKKKLFVLLLALVMIFMLASCSNGEEVGGTDSEADKTDSDIPQDLVIAFYGEGMGVNMDAQMSWSYADWEMFNQTYDTLVTTDYDGITIVDALAESWDVSEDGLTYEFHLKEGIKFHSGADCTSEDVKWTFERWTTHPEAQYGYYLDFVESIETPDDLTVVLNLSQPDNNLLVNLTVPVASILNKDAIEQAEADGKVYGREVVDGTGPFKFVEYIAGDRLIVEKNDDYAWGSSMYNNTNAPHLDTVTFRFVPEAGTRQMELLAGNVHILGNGSTFASEIQGIVDQGFIMAEYYPPYPVFLMFQTERVPEQAVRQAFYMAVDREEIIDIVMDGHAIEMKGGLPADQEWYWKGADDYYDYDIDAANQLLEDNGYILESDGYRYKDGQQLTIEISYCASEEDATMSVILQEQVKKIGINLTINTSTNDFWTRISGAGDNDFDVLIMELYINSAEDMLQEYLYSKNRPSPNRGKWSSDEVDAMLAEARSTTDQARRKELYDKIQEIVLEKALWVPIYSRNGWTIVSPKVEGFTVHPTIVEGCPKLGDVYIVDR